MRTSLTFYPEQNRKKENDELIQSVTQFFTRAADLSTEAGLPVHVTLQHSLKHDAFAVLVECGNRSFGTHFKMPKKVFDTISNQLDRFIGATRAAQQKKEPAPGTKSGGRSRRKASAGVGVVGVLQRRRQVRRKGTG